MSRIAKRPITIPSGTEVKVAQGLLNVKGPKGSLEMKLNDFVDVRIEDSNAFVSTKEGVSVRRDQAKEYRSISGTTAALLRNMVTGVNDGFQKTLKLIGVGYRAQMKGSNLDLTLGFSHPVNFPIPEGITVETPDQTTVIVKGTCKRLVGQTSAEIRAYRPPEPYKGKGIRYENEQVKRKETKKK